MNAGRIENANGDFDFYADGCTQSVEKVIDSMDREILAIFKTLGFTNQSSKDACEIRFGMSWDEVEKERKSWEIRGLNSLDTRYLTEDLPNGLVFLSSLASQYSVPTPTCDAFIQLWEVISGQNFREQGRTMERLRLADLSADRLKKYLDTGLLR
jgi:opine dehydrogenase